MSGLKVLITNFRLATLTGTELYVRDVALSLLEHGHTPIIYSPLPGKLANDLSRSVTVLDHLDKDTSVPDVIHGHQLKETMVALLNFPGVLYCRPGSIRTWNKIKRCPVYAACYRYSQYLYNRMKYRTGSREIHYRVFY